METFFLMMSELYQSVATTWWFFVLKIFALIYITVVIVDIILILYLHGALGDFRKQFRGANVPFTKHGIKRTWQGIRARTKRDTVAQFKVAILEADYFLDKYMGERGYDGENLSEKLSFFDETVFVRIDTVRSAHEMRNRIVRDEHFTITREETEKILDDFEAFLLDLDIL